jgi:hypothetical protein
MGSAVARRVTRGCCGAVDERRPRQQDLIGRLGHAYRAEVWSDSGERVTGWGASVLAAWRAPERGAAGRMWHLAGSGSHGRKRWRVVQCWALFSGVEHSAGRGRAWGAEARSHGARAGGQVGPGGGRGFWRRVLCRQFNVHRGGPCSLEGRRRARRLRAARHRPDAAPAPSARAGSPGAACAKNPSGWVVAQSPFHHTHAPHLGPPRHSFL